MPQRLLSLALLTVLLAACGNGPAGPIKLPAGSPTPSPTPSRPAPAIVQVENAPESRPHSGLQSADAVFEYLTEGGITRFSVLYTHPGGPQKIGPDRSARLVALRLIHSYGAVLLYSGASDLVLGRIWDQKIPNYDDRSDGGAYFARDSARRVPHNLFTTGDQVAAAVKKSGATVHYTLPAPAEPTAQADAQVGKLSFDQTPSHPVAHAYDASSKTYDYTTDTGAETDGGQKLKITSVVLLRVAHHGAGYTEDVNGEEGIDFDLQGTGPADVYTRGQHFTATWSLPDPNQPLRLLGADGAAFPLPSGLTWYHLVDPGMAVSAG